MKQKQYFCYGVKIPEWCIGNAVNSFKYKISEEQQAKVRNWYLLNLPDACEVILEVKSNWIGGSFGTQYYSPSSKEWDGFRLYVGKDVYVKLYEGGGMKTNYRKVHTGHWYILEYEIESKFLHFFTVKKWVQVLKPYYHTYYGRDVSICGEDINVNSLNTNLEDFVKKWVDVAEYNKFFNKEQDRLEKKASDYRNDVEKKRGGIVNL